MKRLLIIAALLISAYSFGQTVPGYTNINDRYNWLAGYLRSLNLPVGTTAALQTGQTHQSGGMYYDSTGADSGLYVYSKAWQRMARASELTDSAGNKITRVYRSNDTVYYCVYNNCTLAFIDSTGGSGGISDTSQYIGLRYGYGWNAAPFAGGFTDNTPVTTITTGSGHTIFAGGSFAAGNNVSLPYYIGSENWTAEQDIVCGTINNTSYGLSFNLTGTIGGTASLGGFFLLSDTMARVAYTATGLLPTYSDLNSRTTSNFIFTTGDTLHLKMQRKDKVVTTTMTNKVNGVSASVSADDQYCTVGLFSIGFYGGSWTFIDSLKITYQDIKYAQVAGIGNSIISGATADNVSTDWFNIATEGVTGGVVHMGAGFEQSLQGTYRMDDILNYEKPKTLLIEYGVNDLINSVNIDSFSKRIQRIVVPAKAAGINPILTGIVPNAINGTTYNDTLRAIASRNNIEFVDFFSVMKAPSATTINSIYGPGGGDPHPYQYGHSMMGRMTKDQVSYLWTTPAVLNVKPLPTIIAPKFYLAQDQDGNIGKAYNSFQKDYIRKLAFQNGLSLSDGQDADIFIQHSLYMGGPLVVQGNSGTFSNPTFIAAANGITTATTLVAGTFSSGNFSISTTPILTGGNFILQSNPVFMSSSPIVMMASNPGGNGITSEFTIDNNTSNLANATDEIQRWRKSGVTVASVLRDGNIRSNVISGYNYNIHGTFTNFDWVDKKYADSVAALGGGGAVTAVDTMYRTPGKDSIQFTIAGRYHAIKDSTGSGSGGVTTMAAIGSSPNNNGATISGTTLNLEPADATHGGVLTSGAQTFGGIKTTGARLLVNNATDNSAYGATIRGTNDNGSQILLLRSNNESVSLAIGWNEIAPSSSFRLLSPGLFEFGTTGAASDAILYTNSNDRIHILAAGNVGIGVSAPRENLDVNGIVSLRTVNAGSSVDSINAMENGRVTAVTAAQIVAAANISSGTYTPTLTNVTNVSSSTAFQCQYMRVGSTVTVSGIVDISFTSALLATELGISLPIASAISNDRQCAGVGASESNNEAYAFIGDTANDRARISSSSASTGSRTIYFTFTYQIL